LGGRGRQPTGGADAAVVQDAAFVNASVSTAAGSASRDDMVILVNGLARRERYGA